jgi:large subunit ribosomal protein L23
MAPKNNLPEKFFDLKPVLSEKAVADQAKGIYHFLVPLKTTKGQIKKAIENVFKVKVVKVNTLKIKGKAKRALSKRRQPYRLPDKKKALVFLAEGEKIKELVIDSKKKK